MKLGLQDIRAITHGALTVRETAEGEIEFLRFTDAQIAYYERTNKDFYRKAFASAGVRLDFYTDSKTVAFTYAERYASSRRFYFFDVFVDGVMVKHFGHRDVMEVKGRIEIALDGAEHRVQIYFPNLAQAKLVALELDDATTVIKPVARSKKLLCYGDSITQGYDAEYASQSYANLLADKLDAEMVDQAIGGERFCPGLLEGELKYDPDIITVAYGTNDWSGREKQSTVEAAHAFFAELRRRYPAAKIYAITPIWRADDHRITKIGTFEQGRQIVRDAAKASGIPVIEGDGMIPHLPDVCSDLYLHPNDFGFKFYANALLAAIEKLG